MKKNNLKFTPLAKKIALVLATSAGFGAVAPANAVMPVFDGANLFVNAWTAGATTATAVKAKLIWLELQKANGYHSHIANNTDEIRDSTKNISDYTYNISHISTENNYYYPETPSPDPDPSPCETVPPGPGCIPVLGVMEALNTNTYEGADNAAVDSKKVGAFLSNFKSADQYATKSREVLSAVDAKQNLLSHFQKQANDARINTLAMQRASLQKDTDRLVALKAEAADEKNSGARMQREYANRIDIAKTKQDSEVRAMMLAQQNADAIRMQAVADQEAAALMQSQNLRKVVFTEKSKPATW